MLVTSQAQVSILTTMTLTPTLTVQCQLFNRQLTMSSRKALTITTVTLRVATVSYAVTFKLLSLWHIRVVFSIDNCCRVLLARRNISLVCNIVQI